MPNSMRLASRGYSLQEDGALTLERRLGTGDDAGYVGVAGDRIGDVSALRLLLAPLHALFLFEATLLLPRQLLLPLRRSWVRHGNLQSRPNAKGPAVRRLGLSPATWRRL